jgi:uncharacterized protein YkwD
MGGATSFVTDLLSLVGLLLLFLMALLLYTRLSQTSNPLTSLINNFSQATGSGQSNLSSQLVTTSIEQTSTQSNQSLDLYVLSLINSDRQQYGLQNVSLSNESSAQQHAQSMLVYDYFSHWDVYGMKPYMRYTLLGGAGAVSENVAYRYSSSCTLLGCTGNINVRSALQQMEHDMMYNDSACCNNGHRDNILDPNHNQVSIGVAYNSSTAYLTEDFIDNYTAWSNFGFSNSTDEMYLEGTLQYGASLSSVIVSFDAPVANMSRVQLDNTSSYGYGKQIAGVVRSPFYAYTGLSTIVADRYDANARQFDVAFNMRNTMSNYGPGEYTMLVWFNDTRGSFVGSTYTIFVGSDDKAYVPGNV